MEEFEMGLYRRILRIPETVHITNKEVLKGINQDLDIIYTVKKSQIPVPFYENEDRYSLLQNIIQGEVVGKRGPRRRKISWWRNLITRIWFIIFCNASKTFNYVIIGVSNIVQHDSVQNNNFLRSDRDFFRNTS